MDPSCADSVQFQGRQCVAVTVCIHQMQREFGVVVPQDIQNIIMRYYQLTRSEDCKIYQDDHRLVYGWMRSQMTWMRECQGAFDGINFCSDWDKIIHLIFLYHLELDK